MFSEPRCPHCGSQNVKKSSAIHDQGKSSYAGKSGGFGVSSSGRVGVYSGSHSGERITKAAEKNAPPSIDVSGRTCLILLVIPAFVLIGLITNGVFGMFVGGLLSIVVVPIAIVVSIFIPASDEQKLAEQVYANQWYCIKCGENF